MSQTLPGGSCSRFGDYHMLQHVRHLLQEAVAAHGVFKYCSWRISAKAMDRLVIMTHCMATARVDTWVTNAGSYTWHHWPTTPRRQILRADTFRNGWEPPKPNRSGYSHWGSHPWETTSQKTHNKHPTNKINYT